MKTYKILYLTANVLAVVSILYFLDAVIGCTNLSAWDSCSNGILFFILSLIAWFFAWSAKSEQLNKKEENKINNHGNNLE